MKFKKRVNIRVRVPFVSFVLFVVKNFSASICDICGYENGSDRLIFFVPVTFVHPLEIDILRGTTRPIKTVLPL